MSIIIALTCLTLNTSIVRAGDWVPDFLQSDEELFCQMCEETISQRLKSPSSYSRTSCTQAPTKAVDKEEYTKYHPEKEWSELDKYVKLDVESGTQNISGVFLKYEASNSYGAQIASVAICEIMHRKGQTLVDASRVFGPKVNGFNKLGWSIEQVRKLNGN